MKIRTRLITLKNGEKCKIFTPTEKDAQQLADYANKVATESKFINLDPRNKKTVEDEIKWINGFGGDNSILIVASIDDKIVGVCELKGKNGIRSQHFSGFGIAIMKKYSGIGIASALIKIMFEEAKKTNIELIQLDVVKENTVARHLYEKFGFKEFGYLPKRLKFEDNTYADVIYMYKDLNEK